MNACCQPRHCADSGGGTHEFLHGLAAWSCRLHCTAGTTITADMQTAIGKSPQVHYLCGRCGTARRGSQGT